MVHSYETISHALQALQRLDQRRDNASLQSKEITDRAVGICNRASALQRRVLQQNKTIAQSSVQAATMPSWATVAAA